MTNHSDSVFYTGITNNLPCRIGEHRSGEIQGFTTQCRCHKLVYNEHCTNALDAIAREKQIRN